MKKLSLVVAASFTLLSSSAFAGSNCIYGQSAQQAAAEKVLYDEEQVDPQLLALLKAQQAKQSLMTPIATFN